MYNNIIFIGGIHGVGKSTICQQICNNIDIEHLCASDVIKWGGSTCETADKRVLDIQQTQDRLVAGLREIVMKDKYYLLDGHYCLINTNDTISQVPQKTFKDIRPILLVVVTADISEIKHRLETRDARLYDYKLLEAMQNKELEYAKNLSMILHIPLEIIYQSDIDNLLFQISKLYSL